MACETHLTIPDTVQVRFVWEQNSRQANNVTHATVPLGTPVDVNMANSIMTAMNALISSSGLGILLPTSTSLVAIGVRDLRDVSFAELASTVPGTAGSGIGDSLPSQIAAVLTLKTARSGRQYRGRMYLPGFAEGSNDPGGIMSADTKTALDLFASGLSGVFTAGGVALGVSHRPVFNVDTCVIEEQGFTTPVVQVICRNNLWDTQRRRAGRT